jgi:PAS domain S-box-containing protein
MKFHDRSITNISSVLAGIISIIIATSIPALYFFSTYKYMGGSINAELVVTAQTIEEFVIRNPNSWQFEEIRLREVLEHKIDPSSRDNKIIKDLSGNVLAEIREPVSPPVVIFSEPVYDSGREVARVEIEHSIAPLYFRTALIGVFSSLLGIITFLAFYFFRIRVLQEAYAKLQDSERKHRLLVEKTSDIVWIADMDLQTLYISPSVKTVLGFNPEELPKTVEQQMTPKSLAIAMETLLRELELEERGHGSPDRTLTLVLEYYHKNGSIRWLETIINGLRNDQGVLTGIHGTSRDVTERKLMEDALEESERKYRLIAEKMTDVVWMTDINMQLLYVSPSVNRVFGFSVEEALQRNILQYLTPDSLAVAIETNAMELAMEEKGQGDPNRTVNLVLEYYHKDGSTLWMETVISGIRNEQGVLIALHGLSRDITERKRVEDALVQSEEKYRTIIESIEDGYAELDLKGNFLFVNNALCKIDGYPKDELMKLNYRDIMDDENAKKVYAVYHMAFVTGEPAKVFEYEIITKNGVRKYLETSVKPIKDTNNHVIAFRGIVRDRTDRRLADEKLRKSQELYTRLVNTVPDIIIHTTLDGNIIFINDYALKISGYAREEIEGHNLFEFISPKNHEESMRNLQLRMDKKLGPREYNLVIKGGMEIPFEVNTDFLRNEDGTPFGIVSICRDISERKRTERLLMDRDERLRGITENLPGVIFQFYAKDSGELGINYISEPLDEFSKIMTNEETENLKAAFPSFISRIYEKDRDRFLTSVKTAIENISSWNFEGRIVRSGKVIWFQGLSTPTRLEDQMIFNGILLNITERKLAEENSRKSEEKFRKIFMTTPNAILLTRMRDGLIIDVNKGFENIAGFEREQVIGQKTTGAFINFWVNPANRDSMVSELEFGRDILHREFKFRRSDNAVRDGIYFARSIIIENEECIIFITQDITEQKQMEQNLQKSEEKYRQLVETTHDIIVTVDFDFKITYGNKSTTIITGGLDVVGMNLLDFTSPDMHELQKAIMQKRREGFNDMLSFEWEINYPTDTIRILEIKATLLTDYGKPSGVMFVARDITERKQMEKELMESQKTKLMGQITSGVAHEVRNPLHAIQAISEAMALDMDEKSDYKEYLKHIRSQVARLSHLMNDLLELGKPIQPSQFGEALLTDIAESAVRNWKEAHPQLLQQVKIVNNLQDGDMVLVDANKVQQVIINLLENASQHSLKDEEILLTLDKSAKNYMMVRVIDKGEGINPYDQSRIFEPFYTTRKSGTGLGLSLCKHIIESHGGSIEIFNNKNAPGCTAWFAIPVYNKQGA